MSNPRKENSLILEALRSAEPLQSSSGGDPLYYVEEGKETGERRRALRRRTRLRTGKLLDAGNNFLFDCWIHDRSHLGARLRAHTKIPTLDPVGLYEDQSEHILEARIVWRRGQECGIAFTFSGRLKPPTRVQKAYLRGRYYAVKD